MKYIKYLFESKSDTILDLEDISLEITDKGYFVDFDYAHTHTIRLCIIKLSKYIYFEYIDVEDCIDRMIGYMRDKGYKCSIQIHPNEFQCNSVILDFKIVT
jgi:hypothetical protein